MGATQMGATASTEQDEHIEYEQERDERQYRWHWSLLRVVQTSALDLDGGNLILSRTLLLTVFLTTRLATGIVAGVRHGLTAASLGGWAFVRPCSCRWPLERNAVRGLPMGPHQP